jgi:[ribosomal protein S18]-alanine N-acetyltransferase
MEDRTLDVMREADLPAVMAIERASFGSPWPAGAFLEEIRNPFARCVVVRSGASGRGAVTAYICFWILGEELLINNLAVSSRSRRQGLGTLLLRHALDLARQADCTVAYLEVRPTNEAALRLYEAHGFEVVRRRKAYYTDTGEDALVMRATLKALETG